MKDFPLLAIRWALAAALSYLVLFGGSLERENTPGFLFVAALLASSVILPRAVRRLGEFARAAVLLVGDTILVVIGLAICGSTSQDLLIAYFLCILVGTLGGSERRVAAAAFLLTAAYATVVFPFVGASADTAMLLRFPFLFVATLFYGTVVHRLRSDRRRLLETETRMRELDGLLRVTRYFASSLVTDDVLERAGATIQAALDLERCRLILVDDAEKAEGAAELCAQAIERHAPVLRTEQDEEGRTLSILAVPIVYELDAIGVLVVEAARRGSSFAEEEIRFLEVIANAAAPALRNSQHFEELLEAERARSEFLKRLARHFQSPATAILAYAELARTETSDTSRLKHFLEEIVESAQEMYDQAQGVEEMSGVLLGSERRRAQLVDLPGLLKEAVDGARQLSAARGIDIRLEVDPDLAPVSMDGEKLRRLLQNLLVNAVRSSPWCSVQVDAAVTPKIGAAGAARGGEHGERILDIRVHDLPPAGGEAALERGLEGIRSGDESAPERTDLTLEISQRLAELLGGAIRVDRKPGDGLSYQLLMPVG